MQNEKVISTLNDLIETCKDGEKGFRTRIEDASEPELKDLLSNGARDCANGARELQDEVRRLGGDPDKTGSLSGTLHRGWASVEASITANDDKSILQEIERGEEAALDAYREALDTDDLPADIREIVQRQYESACTNHERVSAMNEERADRRSPR